MPADNPEVMIAGNLEPIAGERRQSVIKLADEKRPRNASVHIAEEFIDLPRPTEAELHGPGALLRVSAPIPWSVYTVAFVELVERFSYYGTQVVCKLNLADRFYGGINILFQMLTLSTMPFLFLNL
jgi:hypothetical protein